MNTARSLIPRRLDDPPKLLLWDFDQAFIACAAIGIGILSGLTATCAVVGLVLAYLYGKLKGGKHRGFAKHAMYWYTPMTFGMRRTPPSYIREFRG